jgi:hypothetical protein
MIIDAHGERVVTWFRKNQLEVEADNGSADLLELEVASSLQTNGYAGFIDADDLELVLSKLGAGSRKPAHQAPLKGTGPTWRYEDAINSASEEAERAIGVRRNRVREYDYGLH